MHLINRSPHQEGVSAEAQTLGTPANTPGPSLSSLKLDGKHVWKWGTIRVKACSQVPQAPHWFWQVHTFTSLSASPNGHQHGRFPGGHPVSSLCFTLECIIDTHSDAMVICEKLGRWHVYIC
jgi:hypothetical protein